jgi:cell division septation protein DedD
MVLNSFRESWSNPMPSGARGTYEPPDDVHIFDGSEEDDDVEGSRLPLLIVIALFVLAAFAGVVWMAYTQGVQRGRTDAPRTITAQAGPAKVAPNADQAGGTPYKGLKIYEQAAPSDEASDHQSAPPPVNPDVNTQAPAQPETTVATPPPPPADTAANTEPPLSVAKSITPPPVKTIAPPAAAPAPPPKKVVAAVPKPVVKTTPPPATAPIEATAPPAQLGTKVAAAPAATGGAYVLQIGAYKSEAEADAAWKTYSSKHAGTLSGYSKDVKQVDLGAKGTWYRLRVGSFADKNAAAALCAKLTADGGACFPAK